MSGMVVAILRVYALLPSLVVPGLCSFLSPTHLSPTHAPRPTEACRESVTVHRFLLMAGPPGGGCHVSPHVRVVTVL